MKNFFVILIFLLLVSFNYSQENWKAYTNTSYIFNVEKIDDNMVLATWGGLQYFNMKTMQYGIAKTTTDNLSENFIRDVKYDSVNNILYVCNNTKGVDKFVNDKKLMPISNIIGLISDKVNRIVIKDSLIFIATEAGISVFYDSPNSSFSIFIKSFNSSSGLSANNITSMGIFKNHLFCGSSNGLDCINLDSLQVVENVWHNFDIDNSPLQSNFINDISVSDSIIAIATKAGLVWFDDIWNIQSWKSAENESIFPIFANNHEILYSYGYWDEDHLKIIKENNTKFSCIINPMGNFSIKNYNPENLDNMIMGFKKYDDKYIIFNWGNGLYFSDDLQNWQNVKPNCPIANNIFRLKFDKDFKLWLTTGHHDPYPSATGTKGVSSFDGSKWYNYSFENSPLTSDNIISIDVDKDNNVWFGSRWNPSGSGVPWKNLVCVYKQSEDVWDTLSISDNFLIDMYFDEIKHQKWLTFYDSGVTILNDQNEVSYSFHIYGSSDQKVVKTLPAMNKVFFGFWFDGIKYWNDASLPDYYTPEKWVEPPANELTVGKVYDIAYRVSKFGEEQVWFATANGLFMFNGEYWYWYGPIQKKRMLVSSNNWEPHNIEQPEYHTPEYWYVIGQERLYGSEITFPTALFVDPFGSIWIGTKSSGITRFYPDDDIYININMENSPLLSNSINDFAYNKQTGELFIATDIGLNSINIGITDEENKVTTLTKTKAYPNPFSPYKGEKINIRTINSNRMPKGKTYCKIFNLNGDEIVKLRKNDYQQFEWDGRNKEGKICAPGIYFYVVYTSDGQVDKNKFVIVR